MRVLGSSCPEPVLIPTAAEDGLCTLWRLDLEWGPLFTPSFAQAMAPPKISRRSKRVGVVGASQSWICRVLQSSIFCSASIVLVGLSRVPGKFLAHLVLGVFLTSIVLGIGFGCDAVGAETWTLQTVKELPWLIALGFAYCLVPPFVIMMPIFGLMASVQRMLSDRLHLSPVLLKNVIRPSSSSE